MSEGEQGSSANSGSQNRHNSRRRHHRHQREWEYKPNKAKVLRTILITALFVIVILLVWYKLVSRPG